MFSSIIDAMQGAPDTSSEEEDEPDEQGRDADRQGGAAAQQHASGGGTFNFWNMAATMADTVKASAAEIATTVKTTDWRAELGAFGKDVLDETEELGQSAVAAVEQAIDNVEQLPQQAVTALPVLEERRREVTSQLGRQLGRFGQGVVAGTHDLFEQVKDAIQTELSDNPGDRPRRTQRALTGRGGGAGGGGSSKYSRLEAEVAAMQRDSGTYCDEPPDTDAYEAWLKDFRLEARRPEIEAIIADNTFMAELQSRIVPLIVEYNVFWTRYFYRLHLLREKHSQRQQLAQRAQQMAAEEVGWGDDEDDAASPTAAGPSAAAPGPALAATAAAAATAVPAVSASEAGTAAAGLPAVAEAAAVSHSESTAQPTAVDQRPVPEPDEVATASDSTDGGAGGGERWTVVSTGTPTKASAAAAAALPPESAPDAAASTGDDGQAREPAASPHKMSPAKGDTDSPEGDAASRSSVEPGAAASQSGGSQPPQKPVAATLDDDDDDDLADVEVPEGGDGSEVDEDWGSWGAEDEN